MGMRMKQTVKKIGILLAVLMVIGSLCGKEQVLAEKTDKDSDYSQVITDTGVIFRNNKDCKENYEKTIVIPCNSKAKVTLELDTSRYGYNMGGHVQFAFTMDEAHSLWADDIPLFEITSTTYMEEFNLYAGTYTFEMHLIREDDAYVPFCLKIELEKTDCLPEHDPDGTLWFHNGWDEKTIHMKRAKTKKIDLFRHVGISSWTERERTDLTYYSSNKKVAVINKRGILTIKRKGNVRIAIKLPNGTKIVGKYYIRK